MRHLVVRSIVNGDVHEVSMGCERRRISVKQRRSRQSGPEAHLCCAHKNLASDRTRATMNWKKGDCSEANERNQKKRHPPDFNVQ